MGVADHYSRCGCHGGRHLLADPHFCAIGLNFLCDACSPRY
jgi:hypothetical protein